jgi:hypothetical protein
MNAASSAEPRRIKLVVTGDVERRALGLSIAGAFGGALIDREHIEHAPKYNCCNTAPLAEPEGSGRIPSAAAWTDPLGGGIVIHADK